MATIRITDRTAKITANFTYYEVCCKSDGCLWPKNSNTQEFMEMAQELRSWIKEPMNITSGFRTEKFNRSVGGASNSMHLQGLALDFQTPRHDSDPGNTYTKKQWQNIMKKWHDICAAHGRVGSIEIRENYVHIDARSWNDGRFHVEFYRRIPADADDYIPAELHGKVTKIRV